MKEVKKCNKKIIITLFGILCLVFCSLIYSYSCFAIPNDLVKVVPSGTNISSNDKVFPDCDATCFSEYRYIILELSNIPSNPFPESIPFRQNASYNYQFINIPISFSQYFSSFQVFPIDSSFYALYYSNGMSGVSNYDLKITLTARQPYELCPACPTCPTIPENPYDHKLDSLITAIYVLGAIMLTIYFFYCIYGMIIKSTGGK